MSVGKDMSKIVPVQIRQFAYTFLFKGVSCLIINAKVRCFFVNLIFFLIFP